MTHIDLRARALRDRLALVLALPLAPAAAACSRSASAAGDAATIADGQVQRRTVDAAATTTTTTTTTPIAPVDAASAPAPPPVVAARGDGGIGASGFPRGGCPQFTCYYLERRQRAPRRPATQDRQCEARLTAELAEEYGPPVGAPFAPAESAARNASSPRTHYCCYVFRHGCGGGRPVRSVVAAVLRAPAVARHDWATG